MQLFSKTPSFDFMGPRRLVVSISLFAMLATFVLLAVRGLNLGIDFTGGVMFEFTFDEPVDLEQIRGSLAAQGFAESEVQGFGGASDVLIRVPPIADGADPSDVGRQIEARLGEIYRTASLESTANVGAEVGEDLTEQGGLAMLFATILIFGYVMLRFRWKFALGAIAALVHDVVITFGFLSATWLTFDLTTLAAILAVIGYSLNDTIVVYDRMRENFRLMRRGTPIAIINASVNQTLARTLVTGITTLLVLFALLFLGGQTVATFSIALIVGIVVGTYSTIYIASTAALALDVSHQDLVPPKVEEVDSLP